MAPWVQHGAASMHSPMQACSSVGPCSSATALPRLPHHINSTGTRLAPVQDNQRHPRAQQPCSSGRVQHRVAARACSGTSSSAGDEDAASTSSPSHGSAHIDPRELPPRMVRWPDTGRSPAARSDGSSCLPGLMLTRGAPQCYCRWRRWLCRPSQRCRWR